MAERIFKNEKNGKSRTKTVAGRFCGWFGCIGQIGLHWKRGDKNWL